MKYLLLLLLVTCHTFSQNNNNFTVERGKIYWEMSFKTSEKEILSLIDKNSPKVTVNKEDGTGKGSAMNCTCKDGGWYFEQSFDFDFTVEIKADQYTVIVSDVVFDSENDQTMVKNKLENYFLQINQTIFHKTKKNLINMACLDVYFQKLFKIANSEIITK